MGSLSGKSPALQKEPCIVGFFFRKELAALLGCIVIGVS